MDFIRSTSEKMNLWPVEHFFPPFFSRSVLIGGKFFFTKKSITRFVNAVISTNQHWPGKKRGKKVFNWSEVHFLRSTSYEIHILVRLVTSFTNIFVTSRFDEFFLCFAGSQISKCPKWWKTYWVLSWQAHTKALSRWCAKVLIGWCSSGWLRQWKRR